MSAPDNTESAGGAQLVGTPGRPVRAERGEHPADSVLCLETGAGPQQSQEDCMVPPRRPARPARFDDPARNAAYWARVVRIAGQAPPLTDDQRAQIRAAFHAPAVREAA